MRLCDQPHHDGSALYVSTQVPSLGECVTIWVRVPAAAGVRAVHVRSTPDGEPGFSAARVDDDRTGRAVGGYGRTDVWWRAEVEVRNPVTRYRFLLFVPGHPPRWLTAAGVVDDDVPDDTDFRLVAYDAPPAWTGDTVVYEVFPDRFARGSGSGPVDTAALPDWAVPCAWDRDEVVDGTPLTPRQFFGGDLDGVAEHLDHIQSLGANCVYLRPVFPAGSNHRYDASTFDRVDPLLGGDPALYRLARAVHARGMRLVGDITTNHVGDGHDWFTAARRDPAAAERGMFFFDEAGGYESWYGVPSLPKLDWGSPLVRERMGDALRRWLDALDGWRVDVANMTGRSGRYDRAHEVAAFVRETVIGARGDALLVAEHTHDATGDLDRDGWPGTWHQAGGLRPLWTWLRGDDFDPPTFLGVPGGLPRRDGRSVLATVRAFASRTSWRSLRHSWLPLDSFDTARIRTVTGSRERHLVALGMQATLPGTPMICAGSEFGLTGTTGEHARTPMPWHRPEDRDNATLAAYRDILGLRAAEQVLRDGGLRWLYADADTLVYLREGASGSLLMAARRAAGVPVSLPIDTPLAGLYQATDLVPRDGIVTLPGDGPSFRVWRIAGPRR
jgi:alpha-glucosidase